MKEIKSVTWITKKNGKVGKVQAMREGDKPVPENLEWYKSFVPHVTPEENLDWYNVDAEGNLVSKLSNEEYLKKQGREDPRTEYYDKERKLPNKIIYGIDSLPPEGFTKEPPIPDEPFQFFDEKKKKFVVDTEKKERAEKERRLAELKGQANALDLEALRPQREKELGIDVEESEIRIRKVQTEIEKLRPEINKLEKELKSA